MADDETESQEKETVAGARAQRRVGCGLTSFLCGAGAIGGAVYLLDGWNAMGGAGRAAAIMFVVLGTLMVLPLLALLALKLVIKLFFRKLGKTLKGASEQAIADTQAIYGSIHEFRDATAADFDALDMG